MNSIPESADAIAAQMRWLMDGKRRAVLIPAGTPLPDFPPDGRVDACVTKLGLFLYDVERTSQGEIFLAIEEDTVGELLGYGVSCKPACGSDCVVIRGANGKEKQSVVVGASGMDSRDAAYGAAELMRDAGDTVTVEPAARIIKERTDELDRHDLTFHKWEPGDEAALSRLAYKYPEARVPHTPTWLIRLAGQVVGAVGVNSLPLFHLWLPEKDVTLRQSRSALAFIENTYRIAGVSEVAGLVDVDCNSYPFKERLGYTELPDERLCFKQL